MKDARGVLCSRFLAAILIQRTPSASSRLAGLDRHVFSVKLFDRFPELDRDLLASTARGNENNCRLTGRNSPKRPGSGFSKLHAQYPPSFVAGQLQRYTITIGLRESLPVTPRWRIKRNQTFVCNISMVAV